MISNYGLDLEFLLFYEYTFFLGVCLSVQDTDKAHQKINQNNLLVIFKHN